MYKIRLIRYADALYRIFVYHAGISQNDFFFFFMITI